MGRCRVGLGYWQCKDFVSILGNPLFGAMSISNDGVILDKPKSLLLDGEYVHRLGAGFAWGIRAYAIHQFATDCFDPATGWQREKATLNFSAGIFLRMSPSFLLHKF